jgi:hypothetical protein
MMMTNSGFLNAFHSFDDFSGCSYPKKQLRKSPSDRLMERRQFAGDNPQLIARYHRLVARYLRKKARYESILTVYAKMQGIIAE